MNSRNTTTALAAAVTLAFGALAFGTPASAAEPATSATARYQQERAACTDGRSNQDRATCLREAGAALAETRKARASTAAADYERNAGARCERLPDADRKDCLARMKGAGTTSGSVAGGGIYRELVTREVGAPVVLAPARP